MIEKQGDGHTKMPTQLTKSASASALQSLYHFRCASFLQVSGFLVYSRNRKARYTIVKMVKDKSCRAKPARNTCNSPLACYWTSGGKSEDIRGIQPGPILYSSKKLTFHLQPLGSKKW